MKLNIQPIVSTIRSRLARVLLVFVLVCLASAPLADAGRAAAPAAPEAAGDISCRWTHIYSRGETLGVIARWYNVTVTQLRNANPFLKHRRVRDGEILCIPRGRVVIHWKDNHGHPKIDFGATVWFNRVVVWGSGFQRSHEYAVRVRINRESTWYRLGFVRADKDGNLDESLRLPPDLRNARFYEICLKEMNWGYALCSRVDMRWGQHDGMYKPPLGWFNKNMPD